MRGQVRRIRSDLPDDRAVLPPIVNIDAPAVNFFFSAPEYGHHAYGNNIGLMHIHHTAQNTTGTSCSKVFRNSTVYSA